MEITRKSKNVLYLFTVLVFVVFCVLKVVRGANTESKQVGGIWNYLSLLFYPIVLIGLLKCRRGTLKSYIVWSVLYVCLAIFGALIRQTSIFDNINNAYNFLMIPFCFLVFYAFYLISTSDRGCEMLILAAFFICLFVNLISIFNYLFRNADRAFASDIYYSLGLLPFALQFAKKKATKIVICGLEFVAVFLANKRTAVIAFSIGLVAYFLINTYLSNKQNFVKALRNTLLFIAGIFLFYYVSKYIDAKFDLRIYYRLFRIADDGGSGRDNAYELIWNAYKNSSFDEKIIGHGMNTVGAVCGLGHAHDDFLEALYNYGIIASVCLLGYYLALLKCEIKMIRHKSPFAGAFGLSIVIGLMLSLFSYGLIYYTYIICLTAFWGYCISAENKRYIEENGKNEHSRK